jgi:hypothetical protein
MGEQKSDGKANNLETEIGKLSHQVRLQNNSWNRLWLGIVAGVGTAIGASVIAALLLLILGPIFKAIGVDIELPVRA